jgi:hypothetical protein
LILNVHGGWLVRMPFAAYITSAHSPFGRKRGHLAESDGQAVLAQIALAMQPALFIAKERPPPRRMYVIIKGAAYNGASRELLQRGDNWGAYGLILQLKALQDSVKALTNLQLIYINQEGIQALVQASPERAFAWRRLRVWALFKRLELGVVRAAAVERLKREEEGSAQQVDLQEGNGGSGST